MGVFAADLTPMLAHVLNELGTITALVVSGYGNLDELTTTGPNTVSYLKDGAITTYEFAPENTAFGARTSQNCWATTRQPMRRSCAASSPTKSLTPGATWCC
ncbi:MAG: hypothetical protein U0521_29455 [Anaerolineae bacterium]